MGQIIYHLNELHPSSKLSSTSLRFIVLHYAYSTACITVSNKSCDLKAFTVERKCLHILNSLGNQKGEHGSAIQLCWVISFPEWFANYCVDWAKICAVLVGICFG